MTLEVLSSPKLLKSFFTILCMILELETVPNFYRAFMKVQDMNQAKTETTQSKPIIFKEYISIQMLSRKLESANLAKTGFCGPKPELNNVFFSFSIKGLEHNCCMIGLHRYYVNCINRWYFTDLIEAVKYKYAPLPYHWECCRRGWKEDKIQRW